MSENGRQWGQWRPLERGHLSRGTAMSARAPWERRQECSTVFGSRSLGRSSSLPPRAVPLVDLTVAWPEAAGSALPVGQPGPLLGLQRGFQNSTYVLDSPHSATAVARMCLSDFPVDFSASAVAWAGSET
jgi:hypothetical protein